MNVYNRINITLYIYYYLLYNIVYNRVVNVTTCEVMNDH